MDGGPPSVTVSLGDTVHLQCLHNGSRSDSTLNITWWRVLQGNATWPDRLWSRGEGPNGELTISTVNKSHMGMYRCQVEEKVPNSKSPNVLKSCGTYLRVRGEWQPWLGSGGLPSPPHRCHPAWEVADGASAPTMGISWSALPDLLICGVGASVVWRCGGGGWEARGVGAGGSSALSNTPPHRATLQTFPGHGRGHQEQYHHGRGHHPAVLCCGTWDTAAVQGEPPGDQGPLSLRSPAKMGD